TGQFFYQDEDIDEEFFVKQAESYGFDKESYLAALRRIPRFDRETIRNLMSFLVKLATHVSQTSLANLRLAKEIRSRKRIEEILRKREVHLRTLIETIPDLIWLKDPDGFYLFCNPKFERFYGAKEAEIIGKTDYDFVDQELADFFRANDKAAMACNQSRPNEEELVFADDGHRERVETIKTPMYDAEGKLIGVLGIARDITERKRAEEALREGDRIKSQFITTAAHELRTPLHAITGFSELLLQENLPAEQQREFLSIVIEKTRDLNNIVNNLLNIDRIESGEELYLQRSLCDINALVRSWAEKLRKNDPYHRIETSFPLKPVILYADEDKIIQALEHLVSNAVKFSPQNTKIQLSGETVGGAYQVSVKDAGTGMTDDQIERIFECFYRIDASHTAPGGFGLGLSIVRNIIKAHGGKIHVESELSRGTKVWLTLPLPNETA
ncbi:MAG: ATP-binding protein, partial [Desulfuromonadaceae bacterium]